MAEKEENKRALQEEKPEVIIRQHTRWAHHVEGRKTVGQGSLILTNRRLLFLHRVVANNNVNESIQKLKDAPIKEVLDHALTLHKNSFQMPLTSIIKVEVITLFAFPLPRFFLGVSYLKGKQLERKVADFQFEKPALGVYVEPQIVSDLRWKRAIDGELKKIEQSRKK